VGGSDCGYLRIRHGQGVTCDTGRGHKMRVLHRRCLIEGENSIASARCVSVDRLRTVTAGIG